MNHKEDEPQEDEPQEDEPQEDESVEKPVEITIGSKVKWTKGGKDFTGIVEKITDKSYIICCKEGKESGEKSSTHRVPRDIVSLN